MSYALSKDQTALAILTTIHEETLHPPDLIDRHSKRFDGASLGDATLEDHQQTALPMTVAVLASSKPVLSDGFPVPAYLLFQLALASICLHHDLHEGRLLTTQDTCRQIHVRLQRHRADPQAHLRKLLLPLPV